MTPISSANPAPAKPVLKPAALLAFPCAVTLAAGVLEVSALLLVTVELEVCARGVRCCELVISAGGGRVVNAGSVSIEKVEVEAASACAEVCWGKDLGVSEADRGVCRSGEVDVRGCEGVDSEGAAEVGERRSC